MHSVQGILYYAPALYMVGTLSDATRLTSVSLSVWRLSVCRVHRA